MSSNPRTFLYKAIIFVNNSGHTEVVPEDEPRSLDFFIRTLFRRFMQANYVFGIREDDRMVVLKSRVLLICADGTKFLNEGTE